MRELAWGIAATGGIARTVGAVMAAEPGMSVAAVGSRSAARAAALAAELGAGRSYGSYAELCADPAVDAVFVATPHAQHLEVVELAIAHGKAVLCEKPLAATLADAERIVSLAREAGVFLMEAMWMRFNPLIQLVAADERFGEIRSVHASFGFNRPYDPDDRLWSPATGGGALLDLGVYPFALAQLLLGDPQDMHVTGSLGPSGVDQETGALLTYAGGARALLDTSLISPMANRATITGTEMRADIDANFWAPTRVVLTRPGAEPEEHTIPSWIVGYAGELQEVRARVAEGRTESAIMPLDDSLAVMRQLEEARRRLGAK
ncbi:Gfo/Idh/MocA family oxidoreductase [Nonomuraea sp. NBC_01738]|uniref:Gfo/Idh/MocA family protein n=1 Tax=Nonomuraea sp. NBC_01738 TaxID=2976003 RepID=UPI002E1291AC|nr:Gfo/Idh/MocA family oxidoreductase [Nonomuraea sp. NBC_01738]